MAEFAEVVKQKERMCRVLNNCAVCNLSYNNNSKGLNCSVFIMEHPEEADKIIMKWAAEHPEPKYPSWNEAWKQLFPNALNCNDGTGQTCPCVAYFMPSVPAYHDCGIPCADCLDKPIPADIAEKLGIKPLEGGNDRG